MKLPKLKNIFAELTPVWVVKVKGGNGNVANDMQMKRMKIRELLIEAYSFGTNAITRSVPAKSGKGSLNNLLRRHKRISATLQESQSLPHLSIPPMIENRQRIGQWASRNPSSVSRRRRRGKGKGKEEEEGVLVLVSHYNWTRTTGSPPFSIFHFLFYFLTCLSFPFLFIISSSSIVFFIILVYSCSILHSG